MSATDFSTDTFRQSISEAIREIESQTACEIVVTLRQSAGEYLYADMAVGVCMAMITLITMLFAPWDFALWAFPLDVAITFALGTWISSMVKGLRRVFTTSKQRERNVQQATSAAFTDLVVTHTTGRTGVLVLVAWWERRVSVRVDRGVQTTLIEPEFTNWKQALEATVSQQRDATAFLKTLRALGPLLGGILPRQADDQNELSDEVVAS